MIAVCDISTRTILWMSSTGQFIECMLSSWWCYWSHILRTDVQHQHPSRIIHWSDGYVWATHHFNRGNRPSCTNFISFVVQTGWGWIQPVWTTRPDGQWSSVSLHYKRSEVLKWNRSSVLLDWGCARMIATLTACWAQGVCFHISLLPQFIDFKENCFEGLEIGHV